LEHWPSEFPVELPQGILIVLADAFGTYQRTRGGCDFAAEGLNVPGLLGKLAS
jgi:hypothetical protein